MAVKEPKRSVKLLKNIQKTIHFVSMKVSPTQPLQIVYSMLEHEYLGFLFEPFAVQLNSKNELTMLVQSVSSKNISEFSQYANEVDYELVKLTDALQQDNILRKFNLKKLPVYDFFLKIFDQEKGDKLMQETLYNYLDNLRIQILELLLKKPVFVMGSDGNPIWHKIKMIEKKAKVHFHFIRHEDKTTNYFPIIRHDGERVLFQHKNARILTDEVAWLWVEDAFYHFEKNVDGKKLKPFLNKNHIVIPQNLEETYYHKFIANLVASFDVFAKGFEIKIENHTAKPVLQITENSPSNQKEVASLFGETQEDETNENEAKINFELLFKYNDYTFRFDSFASEANVHVEKNGESWLFKKIKRNLAFEREKINFLKDIGLEIRSGRVNLAKNIAFNWLHKNNELLENQSFIVSQKLELNSKRYFLGSSSISVNIEEKQDWFDINAIIQFGEFEIPFIQLRELILTKKREFALPNGEIAVIPEEWLTQYSELLHFAEPLDQEMVLKKHHIVLIQDLSDEGLAHSIMNKKLAGLQDFTAIQDVELPKNFQGQLRPYQKAGYNWMHFLNEYRLGGCLADDMGLGKTVQTLAFIQSLKEQNPSTKTLIVMPTSLTYNWLNEAEKFVPDLKILAYVGTNRDKNTEQFEHYDVILTSYGVIRIDIDFLKKFRFNYVILDESQSIKNPSSNVAKAVMQLNSGNRLILTGTPLENSTMDLWSQMTFINLGLLGSQSYFKNEFQIPIEKNQDVAKTKRLFELIKPFMMRRHKSQVATELPAKVENIQYCNMTDAQEHEYEETKSYFRNLILNSIENNTFAKSQIAVLQGLTKLRQIANHPVMIDANYEGDSGKFEDVLLKLESILESGNKVLVFSQFVKHLALFRQELENRGMVYCYLDGSTPALERQNEVNKFQNQKEIKVFLMSLKAGGLGLNLTAAEYVFLLDPWWNPAIEAQAVDRAHRIGQQNTVFIYKFIAKNTVEEKILQLQNKKMRLFNELITEEETFVKSLSKDDILSLLD